MNIIIPMAGMGKRMRPHTLTTPKPLVPIAGKAMVSRIVEDIAATCSEPIEEIAFIVGRFGEEAEQSLLDIAQKMNAKGRIFYQDTPLGTAHAILCAADCLKGNVFIAFADTLFEAKFHIDAGKDAIIWTQKIDDPSAFGVVSLDDSGKVIAFVEKPSTFVSDLAIIGVYYFKDGENLRNELQYLIDNNIIVKGEYQLTTAMENMKNKGIAFYTGQVNQWLDCGNKDATVDTMRKILDIKKNTEPLQDATAILENCTVIEPCYIGANVLVKNSVIGPYVSLENGAQVENSIVKNSIIRNNASIKNAILDNSLLGAYATYESCADELSLSDYSSKK